MPVSNIQDQHGGTDGKQFAGAIFFTLGNANRCSNAQASLIIISGGGEAVAFNHILCGNQTYQVILFIFMFGRHDSLFALDFDTVSTCKMLVVSGKKTRQGVF